MLKQGAPQGSCRFCSARELFHSPVDAFHVKTKFMTLLGLRRMLDEPVRHTETLYRLSGEKAVITGVFQHG